MAAQPIPNSDEPVVRTLGPRDGVDAWAFLQRSGIKDVFIAAQVWRGALEHRAAEGSPEIHGIFARGELRGLLFMGLGGLAVPACRDGREAAPFGPVLARRASKLRALVGDLETVDVLWPFLEAAGARARVHVRELFMEVDAAGLSSEASEPELRAATLDDLELLARASARAHVEEMGDDPMARNPEAFLGRVARLVLEERAFVVRRGPRLLFKAELSALCPVGAQIAGVFTEPQFRNQGLARRGTGEVARRALAGAPTACLFVRDDNPPAVRAYTRAGFRHTGDYRTILLQDPRLAAAGGAVRAETQPPARGR